MCEPPLVCRSVEHLMTDLDFNSLSLADLKQLHKDVAKAIAGYQKP